jgi:hypothetical protein
VEKDLVELLARVGVWCGNGEGVGYREVHGGAAVEQSEATEEE